MSARPDPLAVLERHFAPELVRAIDLLVHDQVRNAVADLRAEQQAAGGKPWLTTEEAADMLGCSAVAVRARHKRGRLEGRYQGRRLYISAASILDLGAYPAGTTQAAPATRERPGARTRRS